MDRIDIVLVKNGYFDSRENAKKAITMGLVLDSNNKVITKPALKVEVISLVITFGCSTTSSASIIP